MASLMEREGPAPLRSCSCAVLQQGNRDEAVKPQLIPQLAQLTGG